MNLLLDTHIWLWALDRPERLGARARREIERPSNELYLSPISIWEARHIARRGKLKIGKTFRAWLAESLIELPVREAPITLDVGSQAAEITLPQSDIGDILLAATTMAFKLTLLTQDEQLLGCKWLKTLANK